MTTTQFLDNKNGPLNINGHRKSYGDYIHRYMREYAKQKVEEVFELQKTKYISGETGYLIKEDREEVLNGIK